MNKLVTLGVLLLICGILAGCGSQPQKPAGATPKTALEEFEEQSQKTAITQTTPSDQKQEDQHSFNTDTLYSLLVAEIAASRKQYDITLDNYTEQAYKTNNEAIIARTARIAQFFNRHQETLKMGQLWLQHDPHNQEAMVLTANAYLGIQQPLRALNYIEDLLHEQWLAEEESVQDIGNFFETIANNSKQADEATLKTLSNRFESLTTQYAELAGIKVGLSILYQSQKSLDKAYQWITLAIKQEPERTSAIVQEIALLQQEGKLDKAIDKIESLLAKNYHNSRLRLIYARLLARVDIEKAYIQFTLLSKESPKQLDIKFSRALLAMDLGRLAIAKTLFMQLATDQYRPDMIGFYLGNIEETLNNNNAAITQYRSVTEGENYLAAQYRIGRVLIKQNKLDQAQAFFNSLRKRFPDKQARIYTIETNLLIDKKANTIALKTLNKALDLFPDNSSLRYNRSTIYERQDKLALMESDLRHILTLEPDNVMALNGLGYFLTIRTQRYQEAYELIAKAHQLSPDDAAIIDSMGWVHFKLGQYDKAISYLKQAFGLFPDPEVAAHLGEVLWIQGNQEEARNILKKNLADNPDAPEILETLERLGITL